MTDVNIHTLNQVSAQQVFDTIVQHMIDQGAPARGLSDPTCRYRTDNGDACAAGCLIPDEDYSPALEHKDYQQVVAILSLSSRHASLIEQMQKAHDLAARHLEDDPKNFLPGFLAEARRIAALDQLDWTFGEYDDYYA